MILAVAVLLPVVGLWRYQGPPMEEGFMLAFPQRILAGELPHVDFLHLYGPGSIYVLAGIYKVFGSTLGVERMVGLAQHVALVAAMFTLCRPWGRKIATTSALTTLVITISPLGLSAMAWNGALALAVIGLACAGAALDLGHRGESEQRIRRAIVTAGLAFGAALLYRPDMVVAVGLGAGVAWVMLGRSDAARPLRRSGVVAIVGPVLLYVPFLLIVGPGRAITGMFIQPVFDLRAGRSLPVPPSWSELDGFLQRAGALRTSGWPLPMPELGTQIAMWFWLVPISLLVVASCAWWCVRRRPQDPRSQRLAVAAAFSVGLLSQALQRPDSAHLSWVSCISFALVPVAIVEVRRLRAGGAKTVDLRGWLVATAPVAAVLVLVIPFYPVRTYLDLVGQSFGRNVFGYPIERDGRVFYYGSEQTAADAQRVTDELARRSEPGERLIVGTEDLAKTPYSDAFFYYLFPELVPGTRYIEMDPGIADAPRSGLADELRRTDWLIQSSVWSDWDEPNSSRERGSDEPNVVVADEFCTVVDTSGFRLSRRCR